MRRFGEAKANTCIPIMSFFGAEISSPMQVVVAMVCLLHNSVRTFLFCLTCFFIMCVNGHLHVNIAVVTDQIVCVLLSAMTTVLFHRT